ncbi:hypothetical protein [Gordonia caeni]|uniref:Secreted protein n=1 Tax=Gordonia caeni TaxID=1007097 RepID=A0ABP7P4B3_9ACTN
MNSRKTLPIACSVAAAAAVAGAALAHAPAQAEPPPVTIAAAPVSVLQWPAVGLQFSGLVVPMPVLGNVTAATTDQRGVTRLAAPAPPETCSATGGGALVAVNWINVTNGRSGTATVKPCPHFLDPTPTSRDVPTGSGQVMVSIHLIGSGAYPNAGQPSLPGVGTFTAP